MCVSRALLLCDAHAFVMRVIRVLHLRDAHAFLNVMVKSPLIEGE